MVAVLAVLSFDILYSIWPIGGPGLHDFNNDGSDHSYMSYFDKTNSFYFLNKS
jgi:hypothetical protein